MTNIANSPENGVNPEQLTPEERIAELAGRVATLESFVQPFHLEADYSRILIDLVEGGRLPERKTDGAIGYDVYARAIVSPYNMSEDEPHLRETIFNFRDLPSDPRLRKFVSDDSNTPGNLEYTLSPGEQALVGLGFVSAMDFPMMYWLAPRSGLSSKHKITLTNTPGTVDPDYRGEAGAVLRNDSEYPWILKQDSRIAQIIFAFALIPDLVVTPRKDMPDTLRGSGGFGSTGIHD